MKYFMVFCGICMSIVSGYDLIQSNYDTLVPHMLLTGMWFLLASVWNIYEKQVEYKQMLAAEAYQIIGYLAYEFDVFEDEAVENILDKYSMISNGNINEVKEYSLPFILNREK